MSHRSPAGPGRRNGRLAFGAAEEAHGGSLAGWLGAGVSLMLLVGITIWGYQVVMRDVNGIPVVRAVQDPMRIAPLDPGGSGLALYR